MLKTNGRTKKVRRESSVATTVGTAETKGIQDKGLDLCGNVSDGEYGGEGWSISLPINGIIFDAGAISSESMSLLQLIS